MESARWRSSVRVALAAVAWAGCWLAAAFLLDALPRDAGMSGNHPATSLISRFVSLYGTHRTMSALWFPLTLLWVGLVALLVDITARWLDPGDVVTRTLRWSLRTLPCLLAWVCGTAVCAWFAEWVGWDSAWFGGAVLLLVTMPFLWFRSDIVARDRAPWLWAPQWPGLPPVVLGILLILLVFAPGLLVDGSTTLSPGLWMVAVLLDLASWIVVSMLLAWVITAWLRHAGWPSIVAGFNPRRLFMRACALIAIDLRLSLLAAIVLLPLLPFIGAAWTLVTTHLAAIARHGTAQQGPIINGLIALDRFAVSYWWMIFMMVFPALWYWLLFMTRARVLHLADAAEERGHV